MPVSFAGITVAVPGLTEGDGDMFARRLACSPSMVVAFVALLLALGGVSYAAVELPARSVGSKELKRAGVAKVNIRSNAVDGSKVVNESLTGRDVREGSLSGVASALSAASSNHAGAAAGLDRVIYRTAVASVPAADPTSMHVTATANAVCDFGQVAVGGGVRVDDADNTAVVDSYPDGGGRAWTGRVDNSDTGAAHGFTVYAVCIPAGAVG
jgi:hypothetical protein